MYSSFLFISVDTERSTDIRFFNDSLYRHKIAMGKTSIVEWSKIREVDGVVLFPRVCLGLSGRAKWFRCIPLAFEARNCPSRQRYSTSCFRNKWPKNFVFCRYLITYSRIRSCWIRWRTKSFFSYAVQGTFDIRQWNHIFMAWSDT